MSRVAFFAPFDYVRWRVRSHFPRAPGFVLADCARLGEAIGGPSLSRVGFFAPSGGVIVDASLRLAVDAVIPPETDARPGPRS